MKSRGLKADREALESTFRRMSYYRFSGYLWWFYEDDTWEAVKEGTTLEDVLDLYTFDAVLRTHVMRLAHSIEVWLRAALTNRLAERHGPMGYLDPKIYHHQGAFQRDRAKLKELLGEDSPERFVAAFYRKYDDLYPPIWMSAELMSIGLISKWYDHLGEVSLRKAIASEVGLSYHVLSSFLRIFTVLRNGAAHHARIWNRQTSLRVAKIQKPPELLEAPLFEADPSRIQYVLVIAVYIVQQVDPTSEAITSLKKHLLTADEAWLIEMDFPEAFEAAAIWNP